MTEAPPWAPSPFARRLLLLGGLTLALAFALGRPELIAVAAVPIAWLAVAARHAAPAQVSAGFSFAPRVLEGEPAAVSVTVRSSADVDMMRLSFSPGPGMRLTAGPAHVTAGRGRAVRLEVSLTAPRWGRHAIGHVTVECWSRARLLHAVQIFRPRADVAVYPLPAAARRVPTSALRYDRAGDHPAALAGAGVEFHEVRRFGSGDPPRRVNWPVSTRRGELYVTTTRAEQAVDVVIAVDVLTDAGPPGRSSRDLALRGATGVTQAVLRAHDRVGLVAVGGRLRWLRPDLSERQFYRITECILDVVDRDSYVDPDVDAIPYTALPSGSQVVYFTPLLDERGIAAARTLRARGHPVIVVDVCTAEPAVRKTEDRLAHRVWWLERTATVHRLAAAGVPVVAWDGVAALDEILHPLLRPTVRGRR